MPLSVTHYHDVVRGEELINNIKQYNIQNNKLPESRDWASLKQIGFLQNEIAQSYPRYTKINNTTYALDFVSDFDGPYLFWNSKEQQWKVSQRAYPGY